MFFFTITKANSDRFLAEQEGWFGRLKGKGFYCGVIIMLAAVVELLLASSGDLRQIVYGNIGDDLYKDPVSPYTLLATISYINLWVSGTSGYFSTTVISHMTRNFLTQVWLARTFKSINIFINGLGIVAIILGFYRTRVSFGQKLLLVLYKYTKVTL